jgi:hypothetical protein
MFRFNSKKHEMTSNESREQAEASSNVATDTDERIDQLSEERTVIMDIPIVVTPEKPTLTIFDHAPAYFTNPQEIQRDPLDTSLHTVSSDTSIDLNLLFDSAAEVYEENEHSLGASQLHSSHSAASATINIIPDDCSIALTVSDDPMIPLPTFHDFETLVSVSQQLLNADAKDEMEQDHEHVTTTKPKSFFVRNKGTVFGALLIAVLTLGAYFTLEMPRGDVHIPLQVVQLPRGSNVAFEIREDETTLTVGTTAYQKETLEMDISWRIGAMVQLVLFGIATNVALWRFEKGWRWAANGESNAGRGNSSSRCGNSEKDCSDHDSLPSLVSVPLETDDEIPSNYDLSKYHALKVAQLRTLLQSKNCSYLGCKKNELIHRLVSAYRNELRGMTVVQLRQLLKGFNVNPCGRKEEIIQKLVEAGI